MYTRMMNEDEILEILRDLAPLKRANPLPVGTRFLRFIPECGRALWFEVTKDGAEVVDDEDPVDPGR